MPAPYPRCSLRQCRFGHTGLELREFHQLIPKMLVHFPNIQLCKIMFMMPKLKHHVVFKHFSKTGTPPALTSASPERSGT
jgi:hypothetical protein